MKNLSASTTSNEGKIAFYERILAHTPDALFNMDWQGNILYISPAIERLTGYTPEIWMTMNRSTCYTNSTVIALEHTLRQLNALRLKNDMEQLRNFSPIVYADYYHKDGRLMQSEIHYSFEIEDGNLIGIIGVMRNHTEKRAMIEHLERSQRAVLKEQEILFTLIDSLPIFMALVNKEGRYLVANETYARIVNTKREELIGQHYRNVLSADILKRHRPLIKRAMEGENLTFEESVLMPNGKAYYAVGQYVPVRDENGDPAGTIVFATDISQRKAMEERLMQANESKARLLSVIAHDLRSPLNTLGSLLELAQSDSLTPEEFQYCLTELSQNLEDNSQLLDNLLRWAISQMRDQEPQPENIDLNELLLEHQRLFERPLSIKKLALRLQLAPEGQREVYCDREMLKVVLRNLLSNAIKFSKDGSQISVCITPGKEKICLSVKDEGVGMSQKSIQKILASESFSTEGTRQERGTGLGLMLCKDYIHKNKGRFEIESEKEVGSCFYIYLRKPS